MFSSRRISGPSAVIEYRTEDLTGIRTRICPQRLRRGIGTSDVPEYPSEGCPFCPGRIEAETPVFPDGSRIIAGESVTFPNLYPFAAFHVVTVITAAHTVRDFTRHQIADALTGQAAALDGREGYLSVNWNYLPSAGASLPHPHLQGLGDREPDTLPARYLHAGRVLYEETGRRYAEILTASEEEAGRRLTGTRLFWYAHPVPVGEREIRCILPVTTIHDFIPLIPDFAADLAEIIRFYRDCGSSAFNFSLFFGTETDMRHFSAFCSVIARINPNPLSTSDTAFMERLHLEPVIMTLPEDLALAYRDFSDRSG